MSTPIVTVKQGKLKGAIIENILGSSPYYAFRGIPFAAPPVGELRFKDPQPAASWTDIKDVSKNVEYYCAQRQPFTPYKIIGDEDCLYLNVYTNSLDQSKPVMFYIHEGAFICGSSSFQEMRPDYLLPKDVVVVSSNYRVGAFGFLNLGHRVAAGNYGLKDLILALEWVKENISNFGGDPNNVTIFGVSAGSVLVHALVLSPKAKGLFHKAIMQSGVLWSSWCKSQNYAIRGFRLAALLGQKSDDPEEVIEFLRKVPAEDIVKVQPNILTLEEKFAYAIPFGVSYDEIADDPVMPEPVDQLLRTKGGDIPIMISYTADECIAYVKDRSNETIETLNEYMPTYVRSLESLKKLNEDDFERLYDTIRNRFFDGKPINAKKIRKAIEALTYIYFELPIIVMIEDLVKRSTVSNYVCRFSFVGNEESIFDLIQKRHVSGAAHTDDAPYLIYSPKYKIYDPKPPVVGTKDRVILERMTRMWTNFAKTGNPTSIKDEFVNIDWKPATLDYLCFLDIGKELKMHPILPHILSSS
ncbi:esterase E4-like isoform X3 [Apis florea]|uniref:esterase E4-like isoform X3 n=1 Tax=Apis florea TaxID=7463 RepID=UPI000252AA15|nr:esterase E4-like isoform X3 [Apis florea]